MKFRERTLLLSEQLDKAAKDVYTIASKVPDSEMSKRRMSYDEFLTFCIHEGAIVVGERIRLHMAAQQESKNNELLQADPVQPELPPVPEAAELPDGVSQDRLDPPGGLPNLSA